MMILGITGCPGSGKSLLAGVIAGQGWVLVDVDRMAHEFIEHNIKVKNKLIASFGKDIIGNDGLIKRRVLAQRAFQHEDKTMALNHIVHPPLIRNLTTYLKQLKLEKKNVVVDCALIFEWNISSIFDIIVCVVTNEKIRMKRLQKRDGRTAKEIKNINRAQLSERDKSLRADIVLMNMTSKEKIQLYGCMLSRLSH
jgi:dephospho-CoA kinase